jgi:glyoxylase-like metal-dependent hydrolase (beta-lactamase superfamily II)
MVLGQNEKGSLEPHVKRPIIRPMFLRPPNCATPHIFVLGSAMSCLYLIKGRDYAFLGGGVSWEIAQLEAQLNFFGIDRHRIRYLVISHVHHDHCGAAAYLLRRYPHLQTVASPYGAHLLQHAKPLGVINELNRAALERLNLPPHHNGIALDLEPIAVTHQVNDNDVLDLGCNLSLLFFSTPGHSRCSLTTYIPEQMALFPADAVPIPHDRGQKLIVTANHDFDDYLNSLAKLHPLAIKWVGYEHNGILTETGAESIIQRSLDATRRQRQRIVARYQTLQDLNKVVAEVAAKYQALAIFRAVPKATMHAIIQRMVRSALGQV